MLPHFVWLDPVFGLLLLLTCSALFAWLRASPERDARGLLFGLLGNLGLAYVFTALTHPTTFALLRMWSWFLFVAAPLFLLALAAHRRKTHSTRAKVLLSLALTLLAVGFEAFLREPRSLEVTHVTLTSRRLQNPLRIVLLADLQTDQPGAYELRALQLAGEQHPDLVLFAGDYLQLYNDQEYAEQAPRMRSLFLQANLRPRLGAFAVQGDVEWRPQWRELFSGTTIRTLQPHERVEFPEVLLTGFSLEESRSAPPVIARENKFHIVLGHAPDFALSPTMDADLLLAGHTHGGQVQVPFVGPLLTFSRVPRSWAHGTTILSPEKTLIVSRGIGMERGYAPRLRFHCLPQLVVIDVRPAHAINHHNSLYFS